MRRQYYQAWSQWAAKYLMSVYYTGGGVPSEAAMLAIENKKIDVNKFMESVIEARENKYVDFDEFRQRCEAIEMM